MRVLLSLCLFLSLHLGLSAQQTIPAARDYLVYDNANILSASEERQMAEKLAAYARETSTQIVVFTENSLEGATAFDRSLKIAETWGIGGSEEKDNGVLVYVSKNDRKVQIQVGYGAEGFLPDVMARRIIDNVIVPQFKQGRFYAGLDKATDIIMDLGTGEYQADPMDDEGSIPPIVILFLILLVFIVLSAIANKRNGDDGDDDGDGGYWREGRYDMDDPYTRQRRSRRSGGWTIMPGGFGGGGFGSGGGGGFGGGGFGGFGGGGFGGGGAGGSW